MADILSEGFLKVPWIGRRVSMLLCRAIFSVGVLAVCIGRVNALELAPYLESPSGNKSQGRVGIAFQDGGHRLRAGLNVEGEDGQTTVRPQLSSSFAIGEKLNIEASANLSNWNSGIDFSQVAFVTRFRLRSPAPFVKRLDARIRNLASGVSHDTSIYFRSPVSFLNQIKGRVRQSPNGASRYTLSLGFSEKIGAASAEMPFKIRGGATLERMAQPQRPDTVLLGVETVLTSFMPRDLGGLSRWRSTSSNKLVFRFEKKTGWEESHVTSLAYDHSWAIRDLAEIALSFKVRGVADMVSSSIDVTWQAQF